MLMLIANLVLVLAFSACVLALVRIRGLVGYLLGLYVVAYADIVMVLQIAGLLNAVNTAVVAGVQALFTLGSMLIWWRLGRPALLEPVVGWRAAWPVWNWPFALKLLSLVVVAGAVGYMYVLRAGVILATYPDNYDSLTYHLARVGYWLQYQSFYPWPTPNPRQTTFPMNAELGLFWTVLWWGTDQLTGFVQWMTVPVIMVGCYGLVRMLGHTRWTAAMVGLLWATLPQVLYQSSTTQNDLVTASFWMGTVYLLLAGLRHGKAELLYLSGLGLGLALGTKSTSLIALPGLGMAVLVLLWAKGWDRRMWRALVRWGMACVLGVVLVGSYAYVQNVVAFGNPLGASTVATGPRVLQPKGGVQTYAARLRDNLGRYIYQLVDFSPLPGSIPMRINPIKASFFGGLFHALDAHPENRETSRSAQFRLGYINPLDEDASWFGPLAILVMTGVVLEAYRGIRDRDPVRLFLVVVVSMFLVLHSAAQNWSLYKGRYYVIPMAVGFPLIAGAVQTRALWRSGLASIVIALGMVVMFTVTDYAGMLRGTGWRKVLSGERFDPSWANQFSWSLLESAVPASASIGLESSLDFPDYVFFGERFARRVTLAVPEDASILPRGDIHSYVTDFRNSEYLFLTGKDSSTSRELAEGAYLLLSDDGTNSLWVRKDLHSPDACGGDRWPFSDFVVSTTDAVCPSFPIRPGIGGGGYSKIVYLRDGLFVPTIGPGSSGQLAFDLLVKKPSEIVLAVEMVPRESAGAQTLQVVLSGPGGESIILTDQFARKKELKFDVSLLPGTYALEMRLAKDSTEARVLGIAITEP